MHKFSQIGLFSSINVTFTFCAMLMNTKKIINTQLKIKLLFLANKIDENPKSTEIQFNFAKKNGLEMSYTSGK